MKKAISVGLLMLVMLFNACKTEKEIGSVQEFTTWMQQDENELKISKSVNGVKITVSYLPPEYNALKEMEDKKLHTKHDYDSLLEYYSSSASFIMSLEPDENKRYKGDIMYKGVKDFKGYVERAMQLNFNLENFVELEVDDKKYIPALSSLDNTYSLTDDRKINFVFVPEHDKNELKKTETYQFVYHDEIFKMGSLYFYFDKKKIQGNMPEINIP